MNISLPESLISLADKYAQYLIFQEKSPSTVIQYKRDILYFLKSMTDRGLLFLPENENSSDEYISLNICRKEDVIEWKNVLCEKYKPASVNAKIAAVNGFFEFTGRGELKIKPLKIQKSAFCLKERELSKDEYLRLVNAAQRKGDARLSLILQTVCATGIRVSELKFITKEAAQKGQARINLKGKSRVILIPEKLCGKLCRYAEKKNIKEGPLFTGRNGKPLGRQSIWRMMKLLCESADVLPSKVFPHNLRHLFAKSFYSLEKDIVKLADILGHSSINTTRVYTITSGAEHRRLLERMRLVI